MTYIVDVSWREPVDVQTVEALDALLDDAAEWSRSNAQPLWVYIFTNAGPRGPIMSFGLGRDYSFLNFNNAHVKGELDGGKSAEWWDGSQAGYSQPGCGIPVETARQAAREFVRTGERPTNVEWVEGE